MSLIKWNPDVLLPGTKGLFDDFFSDDFAEMWNDKKVLPAVNISENKKAFMLDMAIPGFKKEDFKVEVKNGYLMISAEMEEKKDDKDEKMTRREWKYNSFSRSFSLPGHVDIDKVEALYDKGILKVTLPKAKADDEEKVKKTVAVQ